MTTPFITVRVTFDDGNQIVTSIRATLDEAKVYYLGNLFELTEGKLSKAVAVVESKKTVAPPPEFPCRPRPRHPYRRFLLINHEGYALSCWDTLQEAQQKAAGRAISVREVEELTGRILYCVYDDEGGFYGWSENPRWAHDFAASDSSKYKVVVLVEKR